MVTSSSLKAKKCSTPSCSCPDRTGITRMGREAKGSSWNFCFAAKTKWMSWNPSHTTENCGFCAYIYLHSCLWCWLAQPEPQNSSLLLRGCFFPLSPPTDSWELNCNIFLFCCQPDRGFMESAPWSEISLIPFQSLCWCFPMAAGLKWHSISVPCNFSFFIISFFCNCLGKEVGSSMYTFGGKTPTISRLPAAGVSSDLLQLPGADLIPWVRFGMERLTGP